MNTLHTITLGGVGIIVNIDNQTLDVPEAEIKDALFSMTEKNTFYELVLSIEGKPIKAKLSLADGKLICKENPHRSLVF